MKPLAKVDTQWSPELAYAVGLITTDGSLSIDRRHIVLVSKDRQLLNTFKKCLSLKNKIGSRKSSFTEKYDYYHVQFGDIIFYKWLLRIGLTHNKTKTISKLKIPDKYFFDFLRGYFDGDGCFYSYWDPRWRSSFMFYMRFNSSSLPHIKWLGSRIKKLLNIKGSINRSGHTWELRFAKNESKRLIPKIYYSDNIPCLKRKYIKIKRAQVEELEDSQA